MIFRHSADCMGTGFTFQIEDEFSHSELSKLCESAVEVLADADNRFSLYKPNSEISKLKRAELDWEAASSQQKDVLSKVEQWKEITQGFFDAKTGTSQYDPSGLVKAWATENAANFLLANGVRKFTINAGGDIYLSEELESRTLNRVGLSNLRSIAAADAGVNLVLDLYGTKFRAVATSGISERGEHIWRSDPTAELIQVSVAGVSLVEADIWATAIISGGKKAWEIFEQQPAERLRAIATTRSGAMFSSAGFTEILASL